MDTEGHSDDGIYAALARRGMSRRTFLRFSAAMAAALALPATHAPAIVRALETSPRLPVVWLSGQACGGDTAAFVQSPEPTASELLLDLLSVDYFEPLMTAQGTAAVAARTGLAGRYPNGYLAIVDGAVPIAEGGVHATIGGRTFVDIAREVCAGALGTIAVGSCAFDGGASAAAGGRTGASGVGSVVSSPALLTLPGCPVNTENLAAAIVHYLTYRRFPVADAKGRPLFAYGGLVHNQCERRAHFEFGEFVLSWGDEGAQKGWCLYKMGCKGPETFANCPTVRYAEKASWPVRAGHGCIGCTMPGFWDTMGSAYRRLPSPIGVVPGVTADQLGAALVGGVGAMTVVHGAASYVRGRRNGAAERRRARMAGPRARTEAAVSPPPGPPSEAASLPQASVAPQPSPRPRPALAASVVERPDEAPPTQPEHLPAEPDEAPAIEEPLTEPSLPDEPGVEPVEPGVEPWEPDGPDVMPEEPAARTRETR